MNAGDEGISALSRGDHETAWRISASILAASDPGKRDDPSLPYHLRWVWDGRPFRGRHVLVRCYHGFGDIIQFARYLPPLRAAAASVTLEVAPKLLPLLEGFPGVDKVIPFDPDAPAPPSECDIAIMELPFALRKRPDCIALPYLRAEPAPLPGRTIGLCWRAGKWDRRRSIARCSGTSLARYSAADPCRACWPG